MSDSDWVWQVLAVIGGIILITILVFLWGFLWSWPLMWAWNYVMPSVFGLSTITYWQMFCLYFVLTSLWKVTSVSNSK